MAARSVQVIFQNSTNFTLSLVGVNLTSGIWSNGGTPPQSIGADNSAQWQSESDGLLTGTGGTLRYQMNDATTTAVVISWEDPYDGGNDIGVSFAPDEDLYTAATQISPDDNAEASVTLASAT